MYSIEKLQKDTYLNDDYTPYEVYLKFLIEYFGKSMEFDPNSISDLPKGFKRLSYQVDAVNDGFSKMMKHNGDLFDAEAETEELTFLETVKIFEAEDLEKAIL